MAHRVRCKMGGLECGFEVNPREVHEHQDSGESRYNPWICMLCHKRNLAHTSAANAEYPKWESGTILTKF